MSDQTTRPFWKTKTLAQMTRSEWESLCDGCGQCCLHKLEDADTADFYVTDLSCHMLDPETCRCRDYANRFQFVPDCVQLTAAKVPDTPWLPETCAYRLIADGKDLEWWHPLVSGDPETVHEAGISVRGEAVPSQPTTEEMVARIQRTLAGIKPGKG